MNEEANKNSQQNIKAPRGAKPSSNEPVIFSMPKNFRHGQGSNQSFAPPQQKQALAKEPRYVTQVVPPLPRAPQAPSKEAPKPKALPPKKEGPGSAKKPVIKKKSKMPMVITLVGIILLIVLGVGGYLFIRQSEPEPTPIVVVPPPPPVTCPDGQRRVTGTTDQCEPIPEVVVEPCPEGQQRVAGTTDQCEPIPDENQPSEPFPKPTTPGVDTDSDGLTDIEEDIIYKTDKRLPDSDNDGFLDGNEVFHRYDPNGSTTGGVTLLSTGSVKLFEQDDVAFTLLYPTIWQSAETQGEQNMRMFEFRSTTGEKIVAEMLEKNDGETLREWVDRLQIGEELISKVTKNGFPMLGSEDQLRAFVDLGDVVLALDYDAGIHSTVDYLQTFQMMINSIQKK